MSEKSPQDPTLFETWQQAKTVIQNQDLEHQAGPETRVSNKGVSIAPKSGDEDAPKAKDEKDELEKTGEEVFLP